ncbi:hypothetical protein [Pseudovibrio sp. SPO723]|uniref:hypothetical protein n=1 Tax=Nesiotobacter zosterae TaxID=392721 RepID=UPI0029C22A80|nr:hypothetical protein [Pseudovibrio sp. SPO723]MDX5593079.1 hypothetical protein [Pseudovibrio sp. SPO723]
MLFGGVWYGAPWFLPAAAIAAIFYAVCGVIWIPLAKLHPSPTYRIFNDYALTFSVAVITVWAVWPRDPALDLAKFEALAGNGAPKLVAVNDAVTAEGISSVCAVPPGLLETAIHDEDRKLLLATRLVPSGPSAGFLTFHDGVGTMLSRMMFPVATGAVRWKASLEAIQESGRLCAPIEQFSVLATPMSDHLMIALPE